MAVQSGIIIPIKNYPIGTSGIGCCLKWWCSYLDDNMAIVTYQILDSENHVIYNTEWNVDPTTFQQWASDSAPVTNALLLVLGAEKL